MPDARVRRRITRRETIEELRHDRETTTLDLEHLGTTVEWHRAQERRKIIRLLVVQMNRATMLRDEMFHVLLLRSRSGQRLRLSNNVGIPR